MDARVAHVRELKAEIARLKADNAALRAANDELAHHMALGLLAAEDLRSLGEGGRLVIWDGWNLILGANRESGTPEGLLDKARRHLEENPADMVWVVFDGPRENSRTEGRLRISYTGGSGPHRADRFICDFLRMARFRGDISRIEVRTRDKDFARDVKRIVRDDASACLRYMV